MRPSINTSQPAISVIIRVLKFHHSSGDVGVHISRFRYYFSFLHFWGRLRDYLLREIKGGKLWVDKGRTATEGNVRVSED